MKTSQSRWSRVWPWIAVVAIAWTVVPLAGVHQSGRTTPSSNDPNRRDWIQLFNGRDLDGWTPKFAKHNLGENFNDTVRVENGLLEVRYNNWTGFNSEFGHIFYKEPFSVPIASPPRYRFVGQQVPGGAAWAIRNNGLMLHCQKPETMLKDQDFPISIEVQLLGGLGNGQPRTTANLCAPGSNVVMNGQLRTVRCTNSTSATYDGDRWVRVEVEVHGDELIRHIVDGRAVLEYTKPRSAAAAASPVDPAVKIDGTPMTSGYIAIQARPRRPTSGRSSFSISRAASTRRPPTTRRTSSRRTHRCAGTDVGERREPAPERGRRFYATPGICW